MDDTENVHARDGDDPGPNRIPMRCSTCGAEWTWLIAYPATMGCLACRGELADTEDD